MADFHSMSTKQVIEHFNSSPDGISQVNANEKLRLYGKNKLPEDRKKSVVALFFSQVADFSVIVLLCAAVISAVISVINGENDFTDTVVILTIVILNAVTGTLQEKKAEKSLEALKKMSSPEACVKRDGVKKKIPSEDVVTGDIICVKSGDMISADARIIKSYGFKTDESALTGESLACEKNGDLVCKPETPTAERGNMIFSSTLAVSGHCEAVVTSTGVNTEIGKIAGMLNSDSESTPLQKRLSRLSKILGACALLCCVFIFIIGVIRKNDVMSSFMLAVSLAVAAIPEGLPAIVTVVLSKGVGKLASRGAIIRRLPSCETLGNATVICSDKTGTLTQNKMTVTEIRLFRKGVSAPTSSECKDILKYSALCTNCEVSKHGIRFKVSGEPTEKALVEAALKNGFLPKDDNALYRRIREIPFDSTRKMMTTVHRLNNSYFVISKGAPQYVLKKCSSVLSGTSQRAITPGDIKSITNANDDMAEGGLRVIAVAFKQIKELTSDIENELTYLGLVGMEDPPRKDVANAVKKCKEAGITPVMITGDQLITAKVIAKRLGIYEEGYLACDGAELDRTSDEELKKIIKDIRVYARVTPEHKMRIVKILRECGETVAMTGDGINDAPALKYADIGCAMGKTGTDVAKNASDLILTDDNFSTIVNAVATGRGLFDNIKKAVRFLLSGNIGEIMLIFFSSLFGLPAPLLPVQLLWINLVTDSLPAVALGVQKPEKDIMKRKPVKKNEGIITKEKAFDIVLEGLLFGFISLFAFTYGKNVFGIEAGRTMAFCTLSLAEVFHSFNVRTDRSVFSVSPFDNPQLVLSTVVCTALQVGVVALPKANEIFNTVMLTKTQWVIVLALCLVPLVVTEIEKIFDNKNTNKIKKSGKKEKCSLKN